MLSNFKVSIKDVEVLRDQIMRKKSKKNDKSNLLNVMVSLD